VFISFLLHCTVNLGMMVLYYMRVITSFQFVQRVAQSLLVPVYIVMIVVAIVNIVKEKRFNKAQMAGIMSSNNTSTKESEAMLNDY